MEKHFWPSFIKFDDTEQDINAARNYWIERRSSLPGGCTITDFLEFMAAYSEGLEKQRTQYLAAEARTA